MLRENQTSRPNIYQVLREGCSMQGLQVPIHDVSIKNLQCVTSTSRLSLLTPCRSTRTGHNPNRTRSNSSLGQIREHLRSRQLAQYSPHHLSRPKLFRTLYQCDVVGLKQQRCL